ncbi:putative inorganic phosphate cotransporter [Athalia rosae]|uniref:putative inorganic phosphate cotransporter n=1 Tax=Athalia rosae TaxID=37344 RepID=UPI0020340713|nr:putative inorganic phosphate cotransporter [Athalia rosae]XP_048509402.1 putative inorganic phosphate cotransporter [Athalia rosae]
MAPVEQAEDGSVKSTCVKGIKPTATFGWRHFQAFLMFLGLSCAYTVRVNMSVAIVAMTSDDEEIPSPGNFETFRWEPSVQALILSSFFWGYVLTQVPAGQIAQRFGARKLLAISVFICGGVSLLVPAAARYGGWTLVCVCRVAMGFCQGCVLPSLHTLLAKWAPPEERGRLGTFVYAGHQFGTLVALPISGFLAGSTAGWPSVFYLWGTVTIAWSIWWFFAGADSPANHSTISTEEREYIEMSLKTSHSGQNSDNDVDTSKALSTPWKAILTSQPMWALAVVHCAQTWGFWMLLSEIPTYLHSILDFDIKQNGLISALPYAVMWILSFPTSYISDWTLKRGWVSTGASRKICNSIGHVIPAIALIALGYVDSHQKVLAVAILVIAVALNVPTLCGYQVNHMDLSPNFAGTLMGMTNGTANVFAILAPLITGFIVTDPHQVAEWRTVFFISSGFYFLGNLFFVLFGSGEVQWWNNSADARSHEEMQEKIEKKLSTSYKKSRESVHVHNSTEKERF